MDDQYVLSPQVLGAGGGGIPFDDFKTHGPSLGKIVKIGVSSGAWINQIAVTYSGGAVVVHGGSGPPLQYFTLAEDEYIVEVSGSTGDYINSLQFTTSTGRTSILYGSATASTFSENFADGEGVLSAFAGTAGAYLDMLQLYYSVDPVQSIAISDFAITSSTTTPGTPLTLGHATPTNWDPSIEKSVGFPIAVTEEGSITISTGLAATAGLAITAGIDFAGLTQAGVAYRFDSTKTYLDAKTETQSVAYGSTGHVKVPARSMIPVTILGLRHSFDVTFTGTAQTMYVSGKVVDVPITDGRINGRYRGADFHLEFGKAVPLPPHKAS